MPDHANANRFARFRNGELYKLHLDTQNAIILDEQRIGDVIGHRLNQHKMHTMRQCIRHRAAQIHVVFGGRKRRIRRKMIRADEVNRHRNAQWLRQMRFFGINSGQNLHFQVVHFELQDIVHKAPFRIGVIVARRLGRIRLKTKELNARPARRGFPFARGTLWGCAPPGFSKHKDRPLNRPMNRIVPLSTIAADQVETLLDAAFGADRKQRTAYRLRAGLAAIPALSFALLGADDALLGTVQCWPIALDTGADPVPLVLVGPVAVAPASQGQGVGKALMKAMLVAADAHGHDALVMIGDPEYYNRFFGFSADATQGWDLPGPFERHRLLARIAREGGVPADGQLIADHIFASAAASA